MGLRKRIKKQLNKMMAPKSSPHGPHQRINDLWDAVNKLDVRLSKVEREPTPLNAVLDTTKPRKRRTHTRRS